MQNASDRLCIVGAGQAGCELAFAARHHGWTGAISLIGDEPHPPYQRPPLSKSFIRGEVDSRALYLRQASAFERAGIELLLGGRVTRIDRQARRIHFVDGRALGYARLALAIGGRPRTLAPASGSACGAIQYLRTIDDAERIAAGLRARARLVIVGGGYIGLEVAAAAVSCGLGVTVLESATRVLSRVTAPEMSAFYERVHREAGVDIRTGVHLVGVDACTNGDAGIYVHCSDGSTLAADLLVAGIGLEPNTDLAETAGLHVENGIVVDECGRTSDPNIVAAGDCTSLPSSLYAGRVRLESVQNAIEQARAAGAAVAGRERPYRSVPWFWSDQYDLKLQIAGLSRGYDQLVLRGSMDSRYFAAFYLKSGRVLACDAVNRPREFLAAKRLIAAGAEADVAALAEDRELIQPTAAGGHS
jgi:3-phenylpropionate/trans-cinnamate dioxygenase ferredoxin reductase component